MRIVSLSPFITELLCSFGLTDSAKKLVGVSRLCVVPPELGAIPVLTNGRAARSGSVAIPDRLGPEVVDLNALHALKPTHVFISSERGEQTLGIDPVLSKDLSAQLGSAVAVCVFAPRTFENLLTSYAEIARIAGVPQAGTKLAQRIKAQTMDWCDSFYDRMKNKKVSVVLGLNPIVLGGRWIPDLVQLASAVSQTRSVESLKVPSSWDEIRNFRPDVIIVAPGDASLEDSMAVFPMMEKFPGWEEIPAVKRGEVVFTEGRRFVSDPAPSLLDGIAVLISAIAGLESGYITPRDSFQRLRWLEMNRHKLKKL